MTMITLIESAKEAAKTVAPGYSDGFSETLKDGSVVTCIGVRSSNAFETVVGHIKTTWKLNGKRASAAVIETLYLGQATDEEKAEITKHKEMQKWLAKFGL